MTTGRSQHGGAPLVSQGDGTDIWERGLHLIAISLHRFEELNPLARRRIAKLLVLLALVLLGSVALLLFAV